jgi:ABC-type sugar transport system ATPase subunit
MNFFPATVERRDAGLAAVVGDVSIPLDVSSLIDTFTEWLGRTITVGVRAESITAIPRHEASPRIEGTVEFVEELGSEVIVHTTVDALGHIATKLPAHTASRPGDTITLYIDPANVHCFDPAGPSLRKGAQR